MTNDPNETRVSGGFEESPMPGEEKKNNRTVIIIVASVAVLCCCCASIAAGWYAWNNF